MELARGIGLAEFDKLGAYSTVGLSSTSFQSFRQIICYELAVHNKRTTGLFLLKPANEGKEPHPVILLRRGSELTVVDL